MLRSSRALKTYQRLFYGKFRVDPSERFFFRLLTEKIETRKKKVYFVAWSSFEHKETRRKYVGWDYFAHFSHISLSNLAPLQMLFLLV